MWKLMMRGGGENARRSMLTGVRMRRLPFTAARVLASLRA